MPIATTTTRPRRCRTGGVADDPGRSETTAERVARGDESVIAELHRTYGGRVLGLALRVLGDRQLAEEATQETFVRVWRRGTTFDPTRELEPWLFRIARNVAIDLARTRARRPRSQWADPEPTLSSLTAPEDGDDPAAAIERLAVGWELRAALDDLPAVEREVVRLQHLRGLSHREISEALGGSIGTGKSRSHRAHGRLAAVLRSRGSVRAEVA